MQISRPSPKLDESTCMDGAQTSLTEITTPLVLILAEDYEPQLETVSENLTAPALCHLTSELPAAGLSFRWILAPQSLGPLTPAPSSWAYHCCPTVGQEALNSWVPIQGDGCSP